MEAISLYQSVTEQKPDFAEAWSKLAQGWRILKQWEEARLAAQQAIQLDPHDASSYFILGLCSFQKNQAVNAQTYFTKYLQLAPDSSEANKAQYYLAELGKGVIPKLV